MFRTRVSLSAIVAALCLMDLAACTVMVKEPAHVTSRSHGRRHVHQPPVHRARHRHVGPPGAAVHVNAHVVAAPAVHVVAAPAPVVPASEPVQDACAVYTGTGCYWMENTSGHYCWVPAEWGSTFEQCFALDSCDGGRGESGGGCYKWAEASHADRVDWRQ
jgi:hypothetical protein